MGNPVPDRPVGNPSTVAPHPAAFPEGVLDILNAVTPCLGKILDPMAGIGRIHSLDGRETYGVELEEEWAVAHPRTVVGDARCLPFVDAYFDAVVTSPPYGNRLADNPLRFKTQTRRCTYAGSLGRNLTFGSAAGMQWGPRYRLTMKDIWVDSIRVLRPGGRFVLSLKDHVRGGEIAGVTGWHVETLIELGLNFRFVVSAGESRGWRYGANSSVRAGGELVFVFECSTRGPEY